MNFLKSIFGGGGATSIDANEAQKRIESSHPPYIVDVRQPNEFKAGHLHHAHLIPLDQLQKRLGEIPKEREILCVCHSGARSSSAAQILAQEGYQVLNLRGGMMGWQMARLPVKKGG